MKQVVVAGATGLVGREVIRLLHDRPEVACTALVRREGVLASISDRVRELRFDFDHPASYERIGGEIPCDVLLCALGTTLRQAGSPEGFRAVDLGFPTALIRACVRLDPRPVFGLVSSVGAGTPRGLYLQTKADVEQVLRESGLPSVILRPGLLLGERVDVRAGERLAGILLAKPFLALARTFAPQSRLLWRFAPIEAAAVATALVRTCVDDPPKATCRVLEGLPLHHPILDA